MTKITMEYQAVILAGGKGSRFGELTSHQQSAKPKCLLPVGNMPMVCYPLMLLQKMACQDVIVVTQESCKGEIASLTKKYELLSGLRLEVVALPASYEDLSTMDAIRLIFDKLHSKRLIVLSCDLITDVSLSQFFDFHRVNNAGLSALFVRNRDDKQRTQIPGPKSRQEMEKDLVGIDMESNRLCYLSSEADLEETTIIRRNILKRYPYLTIDTNLTDTHCYVMDKWVYEFINVEHSMSNIKGELIPFLVRKQFRQRLISRIRENNSTSNKDDSNLSEEDSHLLDILKKHAKEDSLNLMSIKETNNEVVQIHCVGLVVSNSEREDNKRICARVNNLHSYWELNRLINQWLPNLLTTNKEIGLIHPSSQIQQKAQIGSECMIGAESHISGKTTLKTSTIGSHCMVEEKVRITNCLLMDHVAIKEGCQISGSIICEGAVINEKCEIKDCIVGKGYSFAPGGKHVNEILMKESDRMMEI